jgi:hypothetical protein
MIGETPHSQRVGAGRDARGGGLPEGGEGAARLGSTGGEWEPRESGIFMVPDKARRRRRLELEVLGRWESDKAEGITEAKKMWWWRMPFGAWCALRFPWNIPPPRHLNTNFAGLKYLSLFCCILLQL